MGPAPMFHRLFVANRGEVAARIARACDALGIVPVFGVSEADRDAPYLEGREVVVLGPGRAAQSYLDIARVVQAAKQSRCSALHPGWGFLSENAAFNALCGQHGITFVGPPAHVQALMGRKSPAKRAMKRAGMQVIPGSDGPLRDGDAALEAARATGFPVLFKAEAGGGGRGMRIAREEREVIAAFEDARAEASCPIGVTTERRGGHSRAAGRSLRGLRVHRAPRVLSRSGPRRGSILAARKDVYRRAKRRTPPRWSGDMRNWNPIGPVALNKRHPDLATATAVLH
jgi:pyruvate carboxylase